jgi:hypothetical protein
MRFILFALVATTSIVSGQQRESNSWFFSPITGADHPDATAELWFRISFEERERLFASEERDPNWSPSMEQKVMERMADWPSVRVDNLECRISLCKIETSWTLSFGRPIGRWMSELSWLGLDNQGPFRADEVDGRWETVVILRRR